jgi:hypothetical protein
MRAQVGVARSRSSKSLRKSVASVTVVSRFLTSSRSVRDWPADKPAYQPDCA